MEFDGSLKWSFLPHLSPYHCQLACAMPSPRIRLHADMRNEVCPVQFDPVGFDEFQHVRKMLKFRRVTSIRHYLPARTVISSRRHVLSGTHADHVITSLHHFQPPGRYNGDQIQLHIKSQMMVPVRSLCLWLKCRPVGMFFEPQGLTRHQGRLRIWIERFVFQQ